MKFLFFVWKILDSHINLFGKSTRWNCVDWGKWLKKVMLE